MLNVRSTHGRRFAIAGVALAALGLWSLLAVLMPKQGLMVSPGAVLTALWDLLRSGQLLTAVLASAQRVVIGFSIAMAIGLPIGVACGYWRSLGGVVLPINSFLRYIPPTAFTGVLILAFGIDEGFKYALVLAGVVFFLIQMIADAVASVDRHYIEMASVSGFPKQALLTRVVLPSTAPGIVDALRVNLGAAWTFLVVAELVGSDSGLGYLLAVSQRFFRVADMYAVIATFGAIGFIIDSAIALLTSTAFRWYRIQLRSEPTGAT